MTSADPALLRTECMIQNDSRLMAGASAVVLDAARRANLSESAQTALMDAVVGICRAVFAIAEKSEGKDTKITLVTSDFPDRVEVAIDYAGDVTPDFGISGRGAKGLRSELSGDAVQSRRPDDAVDRVSHSTHDGRSRVTLTKFSPLRNSRRND
jgi:hypothetical protein